MTSTPPASPRWLAAIEGFYGPPYTHADRLDLLRWLPSAGFTDYAYGPKDDPFHRDRWREPYPAAELSRLAETQAVAREAGLTLTLAVSPGLDWRDDADHAALVAKLRQLYDLGVRSLGVYWDDVAPGGEDHGASHGRGVSAAVAGLPDDVRWLTVGTDYAMSGITPYLRGFAATLPAQVAIAWTGPSVTSPAVSADEARRLTDELGHPLLFCDNSPVNDLRMSSVLHLGPMPARDPALGDAVMGAGFNMMSLPLATRVGLAVAARAWLDPAEDREQAWLSVLSGFPGLLPLARACRSWLTSPGPDPELASWGGPGLLGDPRLLDFLSAGCREGLDPAWQAELAPWLDAWEAEARVAAGVLRAVQSLATGGPAVEAPDLGTEWLALHRLPQQVFGTRLAMYGVTYRLGDRQMPHPDSVVRGENLTDLVVRQALEGLHAFAREHGG